MVGGTHWARASFDADGLPGPDPVLFFAPDAAEERAAELGRMVFAKRIGEAWSAFAATRVPQLIEIEHTTGAEALASSYAGFVNGDVDPRKGLVFTL
jgi:hypothetical protein